MAEFTSSNHPGDWLVVNTHAHRELCAVENLARQGFEPYCPMVLRRVRRRGMAQTVPRALFPSYVFVKCDDRARYWRPIQSTVGVRAVLSNGITPSRLDGAFIAAIKAREADGIVRPPPCTFDVGQQVMVSAGAIDGLVGEIIDLRGRDRVIVLLRLLQNEIRTEIDTEYLEPLRGQRA